MAYPPNRAQQVIANNLPMQVDFNTLLADVGFGELELIQKYSIHERSYGNYFVISVWYKNELGIRDTIQYHIIKIENGQVDFWTDGCGYDNYKDTHSIARMLNQCDILESRLGR